MALNPFPASPPDRPLIVCDIDEVVLEYLDPFDRFLRSRSHRLVPASFRLHGNIRHIETGQPLADQMVDDWQEHFFASQHDWQVPVEGARDALAGLSDEADIVFLTAMPPRHADVRRRLLDSHGLTFPMIATEEAKGPVVADLSRHRTAPIAFLDDIHYNLTSVQMHVPHCLLVNIMANRTFRALAPQPGEGVHRAEDWADAVAAIGRHFSART